MFRPLLAAEANLQQLRFPLLASAKLDGVRALNLNGELLSRTLKPIPNWSVRDRFRESLWCDGELIVGAPFAEDCYRRTVSKVMTAEGDAEDVYYYVFDHTQHPTVEFQKRLDMLPSRLGNMMILPQILVSNLKELLILEENTIEQGYEGLILRDPQARYKFGRSTQKEGIMLKLKRFTDSEALVTGFEELRHNTNEAAIDNRGYTKRSSHAENQVPMGTLGALVCKWEGHQVRIGTGFTQNERRYIWENRNVFLGQLVKFKFFRIGMKDAPRHPVFLGWRTLTDV